MFFLFNIFSHSTNVPVYHFLLFNTFNIFLLKYFPLQETEKIDSIPLIKGNNGKEFFHPKNREHVLDLYKATPEQREQLRILLRNLNVILRVLSARDGKVDVPNYHKLCLETYKILLISFPWMEISKTMHAVFHAAMLVELNDGYPIGDYSESPLEEKFQIALNLVFNEQN